MIRQFALAVVGYLMLASTAKADFIITSTTTPGTGPLARDEVTTWRVYNNGLGSTAGTSRLLYLDVRMGTEWGGGLVIRTFDATGGDEPVPSDADLAYQGGERPSGSYIRAGGPFNLVLFTNPQYLSPASGAVVHGDRPYYDFELFDWFEMSAVVSGGGILASDPRGIVFAQSVVPRGTAPFLSGFLEAETGQPFPFTAGLPVPEPASLGLLSIAVALTAARPQSRR
jgi:hypothetical protein